MSAKASALIFAMVMVFSSFVGCIDTEEDSSTSTVSDDSTTDDSNTATNSILGTVMTSTYHVAELARGVGGDRVTVELISSSSTDAHNYAPSVSDLTRLENSDLFLYHGLGLETWVDKAISDLGSDAPDVVQTHAMPSGEKTLDYQSLLLSEICETLNEDAHEVVTLADHHDEAGDVEIHAEAMTHKVSYPEMDDDHDDHGDDDHGDDHDAHAEHNHASAQKVIENPSGCPSDTVVSVFHLEEGEHLLEFEYGAATEFDMVVIKMMGGHAHHHHGDDDHGDDDHGDDDHGDGDHGDNHHEEMTQLMAIFNNSDADSDGFLNLTELEHFIPAVMEFDDEDGHDDHDDHDDNETHDDHDDNETHDDHDYNETHDDHDEGEFELTPEDVLMMFDTNNDSLLSFDEFWHSWEEDDGDDHDGHHVAFATLHVEEEGDYGFALPSGIEYFILTGAGGHDGHDDHDDHGDDHSDHSGDGGEIVADEGEEAFDYDPHSWLSPVAYKAQVNVVLEAFIAKFPEGEADFKSNAENFSASLDKIDLAYTAAFGEGGSCDVANVDKTVVANHNAYSYISQRYGIDIVTVHGLDPSGTAAPSDIVEVVNTIKEKQITVIYIEEYTNTAAVDSIVQQAADDGITISVKVLYTMELPPKASEDNYLTLMNKNLESLVTGIGC